jgi:hypothetical protein
VADPVLKAKVQSGRRFRVAIRSYPQGWSLFFLELNIIICSTISVPLFLNKTFSWFATGLSLLSLSPFLQNECMTSMARKGEKFPRLLRLRHHQPARASESERRALLTAVVVADVPFQIRDLHSSASRIQTLLFVEEPLWRTLHLRICSLLISCESLNCCFV